VNNFSNQICFIDIMFLYLGAIAFIRSIQKLVKKKDIVENKI